jgi:hypothetical protein
MRVSTLGVGDRFMAWGRWFEMREESSTMFGQRWRLACAVGADGKITGESVTFADDERVIVVLQSQRSRAA